MRSEKSASMIQWLTRLIIVLVTWSPMVADAVEPPPPDKATEDARAAYLRAREHYDAGRYAEAVAELKRAYGLKRYSTLLRYIADSYYAMKKYQLALQYYRTYLEKARFAPDKVQVGLRIRELEESLSTKEEGGKLAGAGPKAKLPPHLVPDGRDVELPTDLRPAPPASQSALPAPGRRDRPIGSTILKVAKWSAVGISVATFAVGLTYNLLARNKARDLERAVRIACPDKDPGCDGNPDLAHPVASFSQQQYDMELTYQRYQNRSTGFLIGAGAAAATAVVLFIIDRPRRQARSAERPLSLAPVLGDGFCGLSGQGAF